MFKLLYIFLSYFNHFNYDEIFSLMVRHTSIKVVLAMVAHLDKRLEQIDVKTTFLHGDLEDQIYMEHPEGFNQPGRAFGLSIEEVTLWAKAISKVVGTRDLTLT